MPVMTYAVPTIEQAREEWSARVALWAHLQTNYVIPRARRYMCYCCGRAGPNDWCNTCQVRGNHPIPGQPAMVTPICNECTALNLKCPVCGVKPQDGPQDTDFPLNQMAGGLF